jgi:cysteine desulfurase
MLCVAQAGSELGTIQPLAEIAELVKRVRAERKSQGVELPLYLLSDSSAAAGHLSLQVSRLGVDLMVINGAKIYGPKQSGALYVRAGTKLKPLLQGGGQERGLRSGTEAVAQAVGLAKALELAEAGRSAEEKRLTELRQALLAKLQLIPSFVLNNTQHSLPGIINFQLTGASGEDLVYKLDAAGWAVATGAACSASNDEPSAALLAIGLTPKQANSSLRLSLGRATTATDLDQFVTALRQSLEA